MSTGLAPQSPQQPQQPQPTQRPLGATQPPNKPTISWEDLRSLITTNMHLKLKETPAKALAPNIANVVFARSTDTIAFVFKKLIDCGILSMPVLDVSTNMFIAFVDMLDILAWIVSIGALPTDPTLLFREWQSRVALFESTPCTDLLKRAHRHPWYTTNRESSMQETIDFMVARHANRIGLVEPNGTFSSILTQHRVIKWFAGMDLFEFGPLLGQSSLGELGIGLRKVITVNRAQPVFEAFLTMFNQRLSGVAVVNELGALIGNISVSDLKDIGHVGQNYEKLFMTCERFLGFKSAGFGIPNVVYVTRNSSLKEVLGKFKSFFVHRVYIVEKGTHKIEGVVTPSDILQLFASPFSKSPAAVEKKAAQTIPITTPTSVSGGVVGGPQRMPAYQTETQMMEYALREAEMMGGLLPLLMQMATQALEPSEYGSSATQIEMVSFSGGPMFGTQMPFSSLQQQQQLQPLQERPRAHIDVEETFKMGQQAAAGAGGAATASPATHA